MITTKKALAQSLRAAIRTSGWSQAALSRKIDVTTSTVQNWLTGRTEPSCLDLARLAAAIGVTTDSILGLQPQGIYEEVRAIRKAIARLEK